MKIARRSISSIGESNARLHVQLNLAAAADHSIINLIASNKTQALHYRGNYLAKQIQSFSKWHPRPHREYVNTVEAMESIQGFTWCSDVRQSPTSPSISWQLLS